MTEPGAKASAAIDNAIASATRADDGSLLLLGMALTGSAIRKCGKPGCACQAAASVTAWQPIAPPRLAHNAGNLTA